VVRDADIDAGCTDLTNAGFHSARSAVNRNGTISYVYLGLTLRLKRFLDTQECRTKPLPRGHYFTSGSVLKGSFGISLTTSIKGLPSDQLVLSVAPPHTRQR